LEFFYFFNSGFLSSFFFFAHISIIFIQEKFATTKKKKCPNTARNAKGLPDLTIINSNFFFQLKKKRKILKLKEN